MKALITASAPIDPNVLEFLKVCFCVPMHEGYGLTETSPVITVNDMRNHGFKVGTVGKVIQNVEVKIAADGEILCKGPNVMMGYYKDEKLTNEAIVDGYFHTGDIGEIDGDGFLRITDRKKEMFKTSGGKYVAPQLIENAMKQSRFVEQIMVIGEGQKMPAAFIQLNFDFVREWQKLHEMKVDTTNDELISNPKVKERVQEEIEILNKKFGNWEQIKRFELTPDVWTIAAGHLTPTMKLKRKIVMEKYTDLFHKIYQ
jgi:long-chain acyl-CoA synthetase